jgi:hypothetical protein
MGRPATGTVENCAEMIRNRAGMTSGPIDAMGAAKAILGEARVHVAESFRDPEGSRKTKAPSREKQERRSGRGWRGVLGDHEAVRSRCM